MFMKGIKLIRKTSNKSKICVALNTLFSGPSYFVWFYWDKVPKIVGFYTYWTTSTSDEKKESLSTKVAEALEIVYSF